jgi:CBS domain containing-hemolysin-like protein
MSDAQALALAMLLLGLNAFFVGAEFALISARRTQIEPRAAGGSRAARTTLRAMENVSLMMAGAQLGITVCSLGLGAIGEPAVAHLLEPGFAAAGVPDALLHPIAFALALSIVVCAHVVIGEMVPKNLALAAPERAALLLGPVLAAMVALARPVIAALNAIANVVLRALGVSPREEVNSTYTRDQVATLIEQSHREGTLHDNEYDLLANALGFEERTVQRVGVPLAKLVTVPHQATVAHVEACCANTGYSRFPVLDDAGELTGYLHLKDVLAAGPDGREAPLDPAWIRPLAVLRPQDPLHDALRLMQSAGAHMARVETGEDEPVIVMLEDVLEELVGEIRDAAQRTPHTRPGSPTPPAAVEGTAP